VQRTTTPIMDFVTTTHPADNPQPINKLSSHWEIKATGSPIQTLLIKQLVSLSAQKRLLAINQWVSTMHSQNRPFMPTQVHLCARCITDQIQELG